MSQCKKITQEGNGTSIILEHVPVWLLFFAPKLWEVGYQDAQSMAFPNQSTDKLKYYLIIMYPVRIIVNI